ncbi:triphosphoribosyl-dephospho-CoA synthase CitG [Companilactobacillus jidongensis]|uniref:triphosphoribosyl-dephospho-CoA synthase CitG n=1 Tax=Companilactobacillus jidongensis TaxID=2486006 RepID=UPI000F7A07A8|nr:triphosphoribosyl-dephospho-CoA synthase CitG [Companilactobacillus jidongensis]
MFNLFDTGVTQDIPAVLANRDKRVFVQNKLLSQYPSEIVIGAKLNTPGPIKNNSIIEAFFVKQLEEFEDLLLKEGVVFFKNTEWLDAETGPERFYVVEDTAENVKRITTEFEESKNYCRLFDLDVLFLTDNEEMRSISRTEIGYSARTCLICGRPAKDCGRSRRHSVEELQAKVSELVEVSFKLTDNKRKVQLLVNNALRALTYEVTAWPKPGLVDPVEWGAHPDMNVFMFLDSSLSLQNYLRKCAWAGLNCQTNTDYRDIFREIREFGKIAEADMFSATKGVNTHKGAVFSLGVLVTAVAINIKDNEQFDEKVIKDSIIKMLRGLVKTDYSKIKSNDDSLTAGEKQYLKYGTKGIRGEAADGYPVVFKYGLPIFMETDGNMNQRLITALMNLALHTEDSTLIKRAGTLDIIEWKNQRINDFFAAGGIGTDSGNKVLNDIQKEFSDRHLSLGGTADLLIITVFLGLTKEALNNGNKD